MDKFEQVYNAVIKRAPSVTLTEPFSRYDIEEFFRKYPKTCALIYSFQVLPAGGSSFSGIKGMLFGSHPVSSSRGVTLQIRYLDFKVDINSVFVANDEDDIINVFEKIVTRYETKLAIVVPNQNLYLNARNKYLKSYVFIHPYLASMREAYINISGKAVIFPEFNYHVDPSVLKKVEGEINAAVNKAVNLLFEPGMSKLTKIMIAHNYLATLAIYDHLDVTTKFNPYSHSAYGTLINKRSVCHGFADAYKRILNRVGIKCEIVAGVVNGVGEHHAWNIVYLSDTEKYHVDITWDLGTHANFNYFLKGDRTILMSRTWERDMFPVCPNDRLEYNEAKAYLRLNKGRLQAKGINPNVFFIF